IAERPACNFNSSEHARLLMGSAGKLSATIVPGGKPPRNSFACTRKAASSQSRERGQRDLNQSGSSNNLEQRANNLTSGPPPTAGTAKRHRPRVPSDAERRLLLEGQFMIRRHLLYSLTLVLTLVGLVLLAPAALRAETPVPPPPPQAVP